MLGVVVIFQLSLIAVSRAGTGLQFPSDPTAYAVFKGWNAVTNGTLTFYFKTQKENGFLMYEDDKGQCEFFYLSLADGRVRLRLKMGECQEIQTFLVGHKLADGKWHKVTVQRDFHRTTLTVDDNLSNSTYSKEHERYLGVKSDLYVGGIPLYTPLNELSFPAIYYESINDNRFIGCISGIMHSRGMKPLKEAQLQNTSGTTEDCLDPCSQNDKCKNGGQCRDRVTDVWCDCRGTGYEGTNCTSVAPSVWLNGDGYIVFRMSSTEESWSPDQSSVAFRLWTNQSDGLLLGLQSPSHGDYIFIELRHGKILVKMDLGQGEVRLSGRGVHVNDKRWHWVEFKRHEREATLKIDNQLVSHRRMPGRFFKLDIKGLEPRVYFGGGPKNVFAGSESKRNFSGYLQEFYFRETKILDEWMSSAIDRRFIAYGTVIGGVLPNEDGQTPEGSGSGLCSELGDDEDDGNCEEATTALPTVKNVTTSNTSGTSPPGPVPTGVQAHRSLPQAIPTWIISTLGAAAALAVLVTIFFLYRWNSRYSGSFKPEPASSSVDSPKHGAQSAKPRIYITTHEDKV